MPSKSSPAADVPEIGDPDRKRLLNVLAQRRYRKRKRDRMAALEAQVKNTSPTASSKSPSENAETSPGSEGNNSENASHTASSTSAHESDDQQDADQRHFIFSPTALASTTAWEPLPEVDSVGNIDVSNVFAQFGSSPFDFDNLLTDESNVFAPIASSTSAISPASAQTSFADDAMLEIPLLKTFKAGLELANLLGCTQLLFDPTVSRVLKPLSDPRVPAWLQPTMAQQTIPHHPFIDVLPWPSVRTKLLLVFSQPMHLRPPAAQGEDGLLRLVADTDAEVEGCRVNGDGFGADDWEVGQSFFTNWWWALDPHIVSLSNEKRIKRGVAKLRLTSS